jgi:hypothetical protein
VVAPLKGATPAKRERRRYVCHRDKPILNHNMEIRKASVPAYPRLW